MANAPVNAYYKILSNKSRLQNVTQWEWYALERKWPGNNILKW